MWTSESNYGRYYRELDHWSGDQPGYWSWFQHIIRINVSKHTKCDISCSLSCPLVTGSAQYFIYQEHHTFLGAIFSFFFFTWRVSCFTISSHTPHLIYFTSSFLALAMAFFGNCAFDSWQRHRRSTAPRSNNKQHRFIMIFLPAKNVKARKTTPTNSYPGNLISASTPFSIGSLLSSLMKHSSSSVFFTVHITIWTDDVEAGKSKGGLSMGSPVLLIKSETSEIWERITDKLQTSLWSDRANALPSGLKRRRRVGE